MRTYRESLKAREGPPLSRLLEPGDFTGDASDDVTRDAAPALLDADGDATRDAAPAAS